MKFAPASAGCRPPLPPRHCRRSRRPPPRRRPQLTRLHRARDRPAQGLPGGFNKAYPDIEIKWVRDSTGVITAKLLAEKANPQADVVMGVAATSMAIFDERRHAAAVRAGGPRRASRRSTATRRIRRPGSAWTCGARRSASTRSRRRSSNMPKPETWKDLTKPVYKGKIVMPQSGVVGHRLLRRHRLAADVGRGRRLEVHGRRCTRTSRSTCTRARKPVRAGGQRRVPDRHLVRVPRQSRQGAGRADRPRVPEGRPGLGPGGDRHHEEHEEARRGARSCWTGRRRRPRWSCTRRTSRSSRCRASRKPLPNVPADYEKRLVKNDFAWAAKNRDKILAEWTKRYDVKSEPK